MIQIIKCVTALAITSLIFTGVSVASETDKKLSSTQASASSNNWSGAYVVGIIGFANGQYSNDGFNVDPALLGYSKLSPNSQRPDDQSVAGGGALGIQWQVDNLLVSFESDWIHTGVELSKTNPDLTLSNTDGSSFSIDGNAIGAGGSEFRTSSKLDWIGTVRPRIGYLVTSELAIYGTGGFAYGQLDAALSETKLFSLNSGGKASEMAVGWSIGAGAEYRLSNSLFVRGEYLFVNLNSDNIKIPFAGGTASQDIEFKVHLAKLGVVYKFW